MLPSVMMVQGMWLVGERGERGAHWRRRLRCLTHLLTCFERSEPEAMDSFISAPCPHKGKDIWAAECPVWPSPGLFVNFEIFNRSPNRATDLRARRFDP